MYRTVTSLEEVRDYLFTAPAVSFDFETAPDEPYRSEERAALDPHKSDIIGVSFSIAEGSGIYVPIAHRSGENGDNAGIMALFAEFAADTGIVKIAHNLAFESMFLYKHGIVIQPPVYDTIAAAQMTLNSNTAFRKLADSGLKTLVPELFDIELPSFGEVTAGRSFDELDPADAETVRYACADADFTLRLYYMFNEWFDRWLPKHRYIVEQIESPAAVFTGIMKFNGVPVDKELMLAKKAEAEEKLTQLRDEIAFIIGDVEIGANASTSAFKNYLFKDLGLPVLKTTAKYQEAADDETMIMLSEWCAENKPELVILFEKIQEYRKWGKLKSTYIDGYLEHINDATERIHPQLLPFGAESGRFSCRFPNLQNQRQGNDGGINVRDFIIAPEGHSLIELDYSQIEARLAAYLSRDEKLLDIYKENKDLHAMTTATIYNISLEEASDKHHPEYKKRRTSAKGAFFGNLYGIYAKSLMANLKFKYGVETTPDECKRFLANLKNGYPTLTQWQTTSIQTAKQNRYAQTALGRRRYIPKINDADFIVRGNAERSALNHGVQGLAADLLKLAMGRILRLLLTCQYFKPILTVHDSLVFECPDSKIPEAAAIIKNAMEEIPPIPGFDVSIIAEVSVGKSYGSMEEL